MEGSGRKRAGGVLAIDHGTRRTGFAFADALRITATPLSAYHGPGDGPGLLAHIALLLEERDARTLLVGLPLDAAGRETARALEVRAFMARLAARFPRLDVRGHDERLTTKAAEELLREAGHHGAERKRRTDSWSALVLLRDWIESGEP